MAAPLSLEGPRGRWVAAGSLVAAWAVFFHGQIFTSSFAYYRDNLLTCIPLLQYIRERAHALELPHWYPYESLGVPFIGQIATGLFHPLTWLLLPLPALAALKWNLLLSYLLGSLGAYRLARGLQASRLAGLTAGVAFGFGGYMLGMSDVLYYLMGTATLPWVAWAALRTARRRRLRDAALLGVLWSLLFLAADLQGFVGSGVVLLIALGLEGYHRRTLLLFALAGTLAALVSCIELLPAMYVARESARVLGTPSPTLGLTWALHPLRLAELVLPGFLPDPVRFRLTSELFHDGTSVFSSTMFAGATVLMLAGLGLAAAGRRGLPWAALGLVAVLLALGDRVGLLPLAKQVFPLLRRFRYPEKWMAFFWLALVPLVAAGVDSLRQPKRRALAAWGTAGLLLGLLSVYLTVHGGALDVWRWVGATLRPDDPARALVDEAWGHGLFSSAAFLLGGAALLVISRKVPAALTALPLLVFLELWHGNGAQFPVLPLSQLAARSPFASAILEARPQDPSEPLPRATREVELTVPLTPTGAENARWVEAARLLLKSDLSAVDGITSLGENLGGVSARHVQLFGPKAVRAARLGGYFNACFRVVDSRRPHRPGERLLASAPDFPWSLLQSPCWPRAFLAGTRMVKNPLESVAALESGRLGMDQVPWEAPARALSPGQVHWLRDEPEHQTLEVQADRDTALVVTDQLVEGWSAELDGRPVPLHFTMVAARGLDLPAGRHQVDFRYRTPGFVAGRLLALSGLLLALGLGLPWKRRAPPAPRA